MYKNEGFPRNGSQPRMTPRRPRRIQSFSGGSQAVTPADNGQSASQLDARIKHYVGLATKAAAAGDHVQSESYHQQAEHLIKLANAGRE